jgi:hypothetical protein
MLFTTAHRRRRPTMRTLKLTQDEIRGTEALYSTFTCDSGISRLLYTEKRRTVFTSEPFTPETDPAEYAGIVGRFLTFIAYHETAEARRGYSPANAGWHYRTLRSVPSMADEAERFLAWATNCFDDEAFSVFMTASK